MWQSHIPEDTQSETSDVHIQVQDQFRGVKRINIRVKINEWNRNTKQINDAEFRVCSTLKLKSFAWW